MPDTDNAQTLTRMGHLRETNRTLTHTISQLEARLRQLEQKFTELGYNSKRLVQSEIKSAYSVEPQAETLYGLQLALCVSTIDPLKQNRVRFFHPALHKPEIPMKALPFAYPVSCGMPGFDDCGISWVPPAGTALTLLFQNGNKESPFYFGSIWNRYRGRSTDFGCPVPEWCVWEGTRTGYLIGKDDETQVFPPWNTWNYNGYDIDSITDFEKDPEAKKQITYPYIYGWKTPEKAYLRHCDGDRKNNLRWKHTVLSSSRGNFLFMKDDHLHIAGQEAHGSGGEKFGKRCDEDVGGYQIEQTDCCDCGVEGCPGTGPRCKSGLTGRYKNKYFKRKEEMRPYDGPDTPLNPKVELEQSGLQLQSLSGHNLMMDDSVDTPTGKPTWDKDFDYGCGSGGNPPLFIGKTRWQSSTGNLIEMNDREWFRGEVLRSDHSYIRMRSALGNRIELNDETIKPDIAGENRGIKMESTSLHQLIMCDKDNDNKAPIRVDSGQPANRAKNAYVMLRSGYGLHLYMNDYHSQETADQQFLQLFAPQIDNDERGPHVLHMQVKPEGPGIVLLRAGGVLWESSYDHSVETVGEGKHSANKFIDVVGMFLTNCDDIYVNVNRLTYFKADEFIVLGAGLDCPIPANAQQANDITNGVLNESSAAQSGRLPIRNSCGPCLAPVVVFSGGMLRISDKVFASSSGNAPCVSQSFLTPGAPRGCPTMTTECGAGSDQNGVSVEG
jgi:hypothetical protein